MVKSFMLLVNNCAVRWCAMTRSRSSGYRIYREFRRSGSTFHGTSDGFLMLIFLTESYGGAESMGVTVSNSRLRPCRLYSPAGRQMVNTLRSRVYCQVNH